MSVDEQSVDELSVCHDSSVLSRLRTFLLGGFTAGIYLVNKRYISLDLTRWFFFLESRILGKKKYMVYWCN